MILITNMTQEHLDDVIKIERDSFVIPFSKEELKKQLSQNDLAVYLVAVLYKKVVAYVGMWHILNEGHIINMAVDKDYRRKGIGKALLTSLIDTAIQLNIKALTLEVRVSNESAQILYRMFGFEFYGFRKNYYSYPTEDAIIMWKYY